MAKARWTSTMSHGFDTWHAVAHASSGGARIVLTGTVGMSLTSAGVVYASSVSVEDASGNSTSHALPQMARLAAALALVEADFERIVEDRRPAPARAWQPAPGADAPVGPRPRASVRAMLAGAVRRLLRRARRR